jgi:hypothetical protein
MKGFYLILTICLLSTLSVLPGCGTGTQADSGAVVAKVGDTTLTVKDFKVLRQATYAQLKIGQPKPTDEQILDRWIGWQIVIAKAKSTGLDKDPGLRFRLLEAQAKVYGADLHKQMVEDQIPIPTEAEVRSYYEAHLKDYTAKDTTIWVYMMRIKDAVKAKEAVQRLQAGEDFDKVASVLSESYDKTRNTTNMGYRELKTFAPDHKPVLGSLSIGSISDAIASKDTDGKTIKDYTIFKLMDKVEAGTPIKFEGIDPNQLKNRWGVEQVAKLEQEQEESMFNEFKTEKFPERIPEIEPGDLPTGPRKAQ